MSIESRIRDKLTRRFMPEVLKVVNESHRHAGHTGDNGTGESHFRVIVVAPAFAGQSRVARQRMVNHALADLLSERIHALAISAKAPGE